MSKPRPGGTRAVVFLEGSGASYCLHTYQVDFAAVEDYGKAVASAIGVSPSRLFKTLVVFADEEPMVGLVPAHARLSFKQMAQAVRVRRVRLASSREAERLTGYVPGGISPFGQRRKMPMVIDETALDHSTVWVSAGKRGLQIEISPGALLDLTGADTASLAEL